MAVGRNVRTTKTSQSPPGRKDSRTRCAIHRIKMHQFSWRDYRANTGADRSKLLLIGAMLAAVMFSGSPEPRKAVSKCRPALDSRHLDIDFMSPSDLMRYVYWNNRSACRITNDLAGVINALLPREDSGVMGQKMICMDPSLNLKADSCIVYVFSNAVEWSEEENFQRLGCQFYIFDPALEGERHQDRKHFYNFGLADEDTDRDPITGWKLRTLGSLYNMLKGQHGDVPIDYVKMDAEKAELMGIAQIIRTGMLRKVKQLGVEIHFHHGVPIDPYLRVYLKMLRPLEDEGMIRFASRAIYFTRGADRNRSRDTIFELFWLNQIFS